MEQNELMHYGVLGMKWGVHKGNVAQAYSKASTKRKKLDNRVVQAKKAYDKSTIKANTGAAAKYKKLQIKVDAMQAKADKKKYGMFSNSQKAAELQVKADRAQYKANKYKSKYEQRQANQGAANAKYLKAQHKAEKWRNAMDKTFEGYDVNNLPTKKVESGKKEIEKLLAAEKHDQSQAKKLGVSLSEYYKNGYDQLY